MPDDNELKEGGSTLDPQKSFEQQSVSIREKIMATESDHRRHVTLFLIKLLTLVAVLYPLLVVVMEWNGKKHEGLSSAFNAILPVVSGLVGASVTYYFTRIDKER